MNRYGVDPSTSAFNHRGSLYPSSSPYRKRQNSGDSRLGGGPATTAGGVRTNLLSSGSPSASGLRPPASSPKRNGTSLEGNRCASSLSPDGQDARRPRNRNPSTWTVEDVVWFVKDADPQALGPHVELFRKHPEKRNEGAPQEKQMRNQNASGRNTELPLACLRRKPQHKRATLRTL